jgi:adenylosuccinate synthase
VSLAKEVGVDHLNVTYVTRPYVTRHGRGPLPHEVEILPFEIVDETNIENEFQETLRFGWLNLDILEESIKKDLKEASDLNTEVEVAINCLDQLRNKVKLISGGVEKEVYNQEILINLILSTIGTKKSLLGYGPDRSKMYING